MTDAAAVPQFLTVVQCAEALQVNPRTVERAIARGEIRAVKIGRATRVPASELQRVAGLP